MVVILTTPLSYWQPPCHIDNPYILQLFRRTRWDQVLSSVFLLFDMLSLSSCYRVFQVPALQSYDSICLYHIWCRTCIVRVTPHPPTTIYHPTTFHPTRTHLPFLYSFPYHNKKPHRGGGTSSYHRQGVLYLILYWCLVPISTLFMSTVRKGNRTHP